MKVEHTFEAIALVFDMQANAAVGLLTEEQLAGGCMCCSVLGDLKQALSRISASHDVDYLVSRQG